MEPVVDTRSRPLFPVALGWAGEGSQWGIGQLQAISYCSQYLGSLHVAKPYGTGVIPWSLEMTDDQNQSETQRDLNQVYIMAVTCLNLNSDCYGLSMTSDVWLPLSDVASPRP